MKKYLAEEQSLQAVKEVLGNKNDKNNTNFCGFINIFRFIDKSNDKD